MEEQRCHARIGTRTGTFYAVQETIDEIHAQATSGDWVQLVSMTGQALMPPEQLILRSNEISSVQEISVEGWLWQKRADELHYANRMQELERSATDRLADAQERLAEFFAGDGDGE